MYDPADLTASSSQEKIVPVVDLACVFVKGVPHVRPLLLLLSRAKSINLGASNFKNAVIDPVAFKNIYSKVGADSTLEKMKKHLLSNKTMPSR